MEVLGPGNEQYQAVFDYFTYPLADQSQVFDEVVAKKVSKWANRLQGQMKSQHLDPMDRFSVIQFLSASKVAYGNNAIHETKAMRILPHFIKQTGAA